MREQQGFAKEQPDNQQNSPGSQSSGAKFNSTTSAPLQRVGNYDLVRRIDMGGMGEVYLARQRTALGHEVAVKIIRSDLINDMTVRKRFLREAEVNDFLKHNHTLPTIEVGEENGRLFLVTPYIKGGTLSQRLRNRALPLSEVHELFTPLVQAVAYLHKHSVVHRNLKPSKILLDHEEGGERVYVRLIDFGVASLQGQRASAPLTTTGHEMGTEAYYMAPERLNGIAAPSNDIYSLGIILYQMLTGKLPQDEGDAILPEPLVGVVRRSIETDPSKRYATAEELFNAFERAYQSLSLSHFRVSRSNPEHPPVGRNVSVSSSPRLPLTPPPQPPLSVPATPPANERTLRPPATPPPVNGQPGTVPDIPNIAPIPNRFNSTNRQNLGLRNDAESSRPTPVSRSNSYSDRDIAQIGTMGLQDENVVEPRSYSSMPSNPARSRSEVVLPPLPGKSGPFVSRDYEAPTSYLNPQNLQRTDTTSEHTTDVGQSKKALPRSQQKRRGLSAVTIISAVIIIIIIIIGSMAYSIYQSLDTATVTVMPRLQAVSVAFNLTAKPSQQNADINNGVIPAHILSSSQRASSPSTATTGKTGGAECIIANVNCKQSVSQADVDRLVAGLRSQVQTKIQDDIRQQAQAQGATPIGSVKFGNETATASPPVDTISNRVTVTVSLQGFQESIKSGDTHTAATQKLQAQVKQNYALMDKTLKISEPKVLSVDGQGNIQIKIAAAANSMYNITPTDISAIQNLIAGKSQNDARTLIAKNPNLDPDPKNTSIRVNYGGSLPGNTGHITIKVGNPSTSAPVQLPAI